MEGVAQGGLWHSCVTATFHNPIACTREGWVVIALCLCTAHWIKNNYHNLVDGKNEFLLHFFDRTQPWEAMSHPKNGKTLTYHTSKYTGIWADAAIWSQNLLKIFGWEVIANQRQATNFWQLLSLLSFIPPATTNLMTNDYAKINNYVTMKKVNWVSW